MDPLFSKARAFTDIEDQTLLAWVQALNARLNPEAQAVLDAGLYLEHLTSLLPADSDEWTPTQVAEIQRATTLLNAALDAIAIALTRLEALRAADSPEGHGGGALPAGEGPGYGR